MYSSTQVANEFLALSFKNKRLVSPMKLLKLVYFAHGWYLAIYDKPLINEQIQAWKYGPVIADLYREVRSFGQSSINELLFKSDFVELDDDSVLYGKKAMTTPRIPDNPENANALEIINKVWELYGKFSPVQLSNMTHEKGTPWFDTYMPMRDNPIRYTDIPSDLIKRKFRERAK